MGLHHLQKYISKTITKTILSNNFFFLKEEELSDYKRWRDTSANWDMWTFMDSDLNKPNTDWVSDHNMVLGITVL